MVYPPVYLRTCGAEGRLQPIILNHANQNINIKNAPGVRTILFKTEHYQLILKTPTVGLEPMTTRLRALRSTD